MKQRILLRADGNKNIGFGHLNRLLALADILKDDFSCVFISNRPDAINRQRIMDVCALIELNDDYTYPAPDLMTLENQMPFNLDGIVNRNDIVVLDGYHFMQQYQQALHDTGCKQVVIDDLMGDYPFANMVVNHAPGIVPDDYKTHARFCLGLDYALLRKPFFAPFKTNKQNNNIYVSMGGADRDGYTVLVCEALLQVNRFEHLHILCSDQFEAKQLEQLKALEKQHNLALYFNLDAKAIVDVMDECTEAFVVASTVMVEAYARGLVCYTACSAQNQMYLYNGFVDNEYAKGFGNLKKLSARTIVETLSASRAKVDNVLQVPLQSVNNFRKAFNELAHGIS